VVLFDRQVLGEAEGVGAGLGKDHTWAKGVRKAVEGGRERIT
jgi:hypothetical protein